VVAGELAGTWTTPNGQRKGKVFNVDIFASDRKVFSVDIFAFDRKAKMRIILTRSQSENENHSHAIAKRK